MYENRKLGFMYVLPFVIGVALFKLFPFVMSFALSFTQYDLIEPPKYIGVENYREMFTTDKLFPKSLGITLMFVALTVPLRLAAALFVAQILNFKLRGINFFRSAFYLPSILGGSIAVSILWRFIFSRNGLINQALIALGFEPILWLADEQYSLWTIVLLNVWQFGSSMIIFLAGLKQIPQEYYDAASVDGATRVRQFFSITIPLLSPVILFTLVIQIISAFQVFTQAYIIGGGKGGVLNSTLFYTLHLYIHHNCF